MKNIMIGMIKFYQKIPLPSHKMCRFEPTCSNYAIEAIETYGCGKGFILSLKRLLKCNPWGPHGYDPVPKKENANEKNKKNIIRN